MILCVLVIAMSSRVNTGGTEQNDLIFEYIHHQISYRYTFSNNVVKCRFLVLTSPSPFNGATHMVIGDIR